MIELVGLPGVGKSFLCRALERAYEDDKAVRVVTETEVESFGVSRAVLEKLSRAARFAVLHARTTGKLVRTVRGRGPLLQRGRLSKLVNLLSETDRVSHAPPRETCICSQGVLQAVWSLDMRSDEPVRTELLTALSRWLPEAVVHVEADRAEYETRLRERRGGRSHFDRLERDGLPEAIARGQSCMSAILDDWAGCVSTARRLDFWNGRDARTDAVVDWVDALRAERRAMASDALARSSAGEVRRPSD